MDKGNYVTIRMTKAEHDVKYKALKYYVEYLITRPTSKLSELVDDLNDWAICQLMVAEIDEKLKEVKPNED